MTNPFKIIKDDHRNVEKLFKEYEAHGEKAYEKRQNTADTIFNELDVHARMEEEILYPKLKEAFNKDGDALVEEAFAEHDVVKQLISELKEISPEDEVFNAKMTVLKENLEHHIEEEEKALLPKAEKKLSEIDQEEISQAMIDFKNDAM